MKALYFMKFYLLTLFTALLTVHGKAQDLGGTAEDKASLSKTTQAIRDAFAKGDARLAANYHHPAVVKYFGGNNVVTGRDQLEKGLADWFSRFKVEFLESKVETTVFTGETAIQSSIFAIKSTPIKGGEASVAKGRAVVVYIRDKTSPTGWLSLREIAQEGPEK